MIQQMLKLVRFALEKRTRLVVSLGAAATASWATLTSSAGVVSADDGISSGSSWSAGEKKRVGMESVGGGTFKRCRGCEDETSHGLRMGDYLRHLYGDSSVSADSSSETKNNSSPTPIPQHPTTSQHTTLHAKPQSTSSNSSTSPSTPYFPPESALTYTSRDGRPCPANARQLGNSGWLLLHSIAAYYSESPSKQDKDNMSALLPSFAYAYPCSYCAEHMKKYIIDNPPDLTNNKVSFSFYHINLCILSLLTSYN